MRSLTMACYLEHVAVLLLAVVGHTLGMSTCSEKVGNILLEGERLQGSYLHDLATNYYWAGLGVGPDKTGFTSIFLEYSKLRQNELGENYLILSITRTFDNMTSTTFETKWTQQGNDRFFAAEYPDGQYNIYHYYYKGLIVFHRCSLVCIEDGNVSYTVFAPINKKEEQVIDIIEELEARLYSKIPENLIRLDYPVINYKYKA